MNRPAKASVLIVDDEDDMREGLAETLLGAGYDVDTAQDGRVALDLAQSREYDVALVDLKMPGPDGLLVLNRIVTLCATTQVVIITGHATVESAVEAMKNGACDYIPKPFKLDHVRWVVARAVERKRLQDENRRLRNEVAGYRQRTIIGGSAPMRALMEMVDRVARSSSTVLIVGETGTGKELVARAVHERSDRAEQAFVPFNCGAIAESLVESQLFGHKRGAFTGATEDREGVFETARGGTLFFDEVGELSPAMQVRLLRVLQEREVQRLGEVRRRQVDVRLVAATHRDLDAEIRAGRFRQDLYYRLEVAHISVPPLRDRRDDIEALTQYCLARLSGDMGKPAPRLTAAAVRKLAAHDWPGNVRELENAVERALLFYDGPEMLPDHLDLTGQRDQSTQAPDGSDHSESLRQVERRHIERVLRACDFNQTRAAHKLGIGRRTLYRKLKEYGIGTEDR